MASLAPLLSDLTHKLLLEFLAGASVDIYIISIIYFRNISPPNQKANFQLQGEGLEK